MATQLMRRAPAYVRRQPLCRSLSTFSSFTELEHTMWQSGAAAYESSFAEVTIQAANALLDGAGVHRTPAAMVSYVEKTELSAEGRASGPRVLDVATGPGKIAEEAAFRGASSVVALDFSSQMLVSAQPVADAYPGVVELCEGDAQKLPFPDASFDSVIIGFGLLHFPQPELAVKEAFRVLKSGGRLSFSVWAEGNQSIIRASDSVYVEQLCAELQTDPIRQPQPNARTCHMHMHVPNHAQGTYAGGAEWLRDHPAGHRRAWRHKRFPPRRRGGQGRPPFLPLCVARECSRRPRGLWVRRNLHHA